jgi:hypothetical protein
MLSEVGMVRNIVLAFLSLSLVTTACRQDEEPAASGEQVAIAAPIAGGAMVTWVTVGAGVSLAAFTAVHTDYISKTRATIGGFLWDFATYSNPESRSRLDQYFLGSTSLTPDAQRIGDFVMASAKNLPKPRVFGDVRKAAAAKQTAECREATANSEKQVAVNNTSCQDPGLTCAAAVRTHMSGVGGANWTLGQCTCSKEKGVWTNCTLPDGKTPLLEKK